LVQGRRGDGMLHTVHDTYDGQRVQLVMPRAKGSEEGDFTPEV
jgi:hypothetical protein